MTYAFVQDVPIGPDTYARISEGVGRSAPPGLVVHLAMALPDGGVRYLDVWEDEATFARFHEDRVHPVVHEVLGDLFGGSLPPEPPRDRLDVIDVWRP